MVAKKGTPRKAAASKANEPTNDGAAMLSSTADELMMRALEGGGEPLTTGRHLITFQEEGFDEGSAALSSQGLSVADTRDFEDQALSIEEAGDADALVFPELGVALVGETALEERGMSAESMIADDTPVQMVEPEYFVFSDNREYFRGFLSATNTIAADLSGEGEEAEPEDLVGAQAAAGVTWGLTQCKVPPSSRSGQGIKVAVLDTGMDVGHPDFLGRSFTTRSFVGQPVQDMHSHGTHCIGTACGPKEPRFPWPFQQPRYGIAYGAKIFVGKVLQNNGFSVGGSVLAGMNWAIANGCEVISMSLGSQSPVSAAYTNAGRAAITKGCLIIAAAGNASSSTGAPANSPTIMSVASVDPPWFNIFWRTSSFSNFGKIDIAAPGRDVRSSVPRPRFPPYGDKSGTSMAAPHVAGCAALWAESSAGLRGQSLWNKLTSSAVPLRSFSGLLPRSRVGAGLVQAP